MFWGNGKGFFSSGGDQGPTGQVIGLAEKPARALLNSGDGRLFEGVCFKAGQGQVMEEIGLHLLSRDALEVTAGQDKGSQGMGSAENELIDQRTLSGQDDGQVGFGVLVELGEGVELRKDFQS